jgi:hypothetical protein
MMQSSFSFCSVASVPRLCAGGRKLSAAVEASDSYGINIAKDDTQDEK